MKKTTLLLTALLLTTAPLFSQTEKSATPLSPAHALTRSPAATRAVVVGISDYQDPGIPDLRFADRDAEAFANYLRSPAGGALDGDHLKVLTNQQATMGKVAAALDWLLDVCQEGDQAIIYFSGHGDVERKIISQPGYLLCWDAPPQVYMSGGAFNLRDLEAIVSTLSTQNKVRAVVVADACHAGKLSGSGIGGAQITGASLARQYANEIKILSCQPNEYSIEGEQWGGGRGAFSFNLVDALYGMADGNNDLSVNLREVGRYLEDRVTAEVAPVSQNPKVVGDPNERLASVDVRLLADLRSGRTSQMKMLFAIESRGMEDDVLATVDTTVQEIYRLFKKALKDRVFLEPSNACAEVYYERLTAEPGLARLHSTIRRNYAAALQDDAQMVINKWLKSDLSEFTYSKKATTEKYRTFPKQIERAATLLGEQHYMYPVLQARKHLFEGWLLFLSISNPDKELINKSLTEMRCALHWYSELPQAYWIMSDLFGYYLLQPDSAEQYARKAMELCPSWLFPCTSIAAFFSSIGEFDRAKPYLEQAIRIDSNSAIVWNTWGYYYHDQKQYAKAEQQYKKSVQLDPDNANAYYNLACCQSLQGRVRNANEYLEQALKSGFIGYNWIQNDPDLTPLRALPEWKTLMKKYFPDQVKD